MRAAKTLRGAVSNALLRCLAECASPLISCACAAAADWPRERDGSADTALIRKARRVEWLFVACHDGQVADQVKLSPSLCSAISLASLATLSRCPPRQRALQCLWISSLPVVACGFCFVETHLACQQPRRQIEKRVECQDWQRTTSCHRCSNSPYPCFPFPLAFTSIDGALPLFVQLYFPECTAIVVKVLFVSWCFISAASGLGPIGCVPCRLYSVTHARSWGAHFRSKA